MQANWKEDELLARANERVQQGLDLRLDPERLAQIAAREGIDWATALLYQALLHSPVHGPAIARLRALPTAATPGALAGTRVVIVPGAFYRKFPQSGAGGHLVRDVAEQFGCESAVLPLDEFGPVRENARAISDWLQRQPEGDLILVSLSKGGSEMKLALAAPDAAHTFRNVKAWVNLSGLLRGSPMVAWVFSRWHRRLRYRLIMGAQGFNANHLRDLAPGKAGLLDFDLRFPSGMEVIHVLGFALARHLTNPLGRRYYRRLKPFGPNDGGILLAETCREPGVLYPVWGADHYLRPPGGDMRTVAAQVLHYLAEQLHPARPAIETAGAIP